MSSEENIVPPAAKSRAGDILRVGAIAVPWICAALFPVLVLSGFYDNVGNVGRLLFFDFVMVPLANIAFLGITASGDGSFGLISFLVFAGIICPPALAFSFVRWWRSRAFWLVWVGHLAFLAESTLLATYLVAALSTLVNLRGGLSL